MLAPLVRLSDRLLAHLAPKVDASASCNYVWRPCFCSGGLRYGRRCMSGCPGVANHCHSCDVMGTC